MFDVGWSEMALVIGAAIVLTKPEDMPSLLHKLGKMLRKAKALTSEIQSSIDRVMEEAEVDEIAKEVNARIGGENLQFEIERQIEEEEKRAGKDLQKSDE